MTSRVCWNSDDTARPVEMHRNDSGVQLVVTIYKLGAKKSRDGINILGRIPHQDLQVCMLPPLHMMLEAQIPPVFTLGHLFFPCSVYSD